MLILIGSNIRKLNNPAVCTIATLLHQLKIFLLCFKLYISSIEILIHMKMKLLYYQVISCLFFTLYYAVPLNAQSIKSPYLKKGAYCTQLVVDGKPTLLLCGELGNSSTSVVEYSDLAFEKVKKMGLNSVIGSISWCQFEPIEGCFNYSEIDGLIKNAEKHKLKLVIIWFASYKNGKSSYAPDWVKTNEKRFPRVNASNMENYLAGEKSDLFVMNTLSPFFEETWKADAKAFAELMKRIKKVDKNHTVVMMQVENEAGAANVAIDQQPGAEELFNESVPKQLIQYLIKHKNEIVPALSKAWAECGNKAEGTWREVFGSISIDAFMAWHYASFMEHVTAAGKAEYNIPMYYNAWIKQPKDKPGRYPSGGPVHTVLDIYRAASPSVDLLSPDLYSPAFKQYCVAYDHPGNALFIPECRSDEASIAKAYWTLAEKKGIGFAPFAVELMSEKSSLVEGYRVLDQLMPLILERQGTNKIHGIYRQVNPSKRKIDVGQWDFDAGELEMEDNTNTEVTFGNWTFKVQFTESVKNEAAYGLIIQLSDDEFVITGKNLQISQTHKDNSLRAEQLYVQQGDFVDGQWKVRRWLNGDETAHGVVVSLPTSNDIFLPENRQDIIKIKLYAYPDKVTK